MQFIFKYSYIFIFLSVEKPFQIPNEMNKFSYHTLVRTPNRFSYN